MDDEVFWQVVARLGPLPREQAGRVPAVMGGMTAEELEEWFRLFVSKTRELRTHRHTACAEVFYGGLGDDGSADFRAGVVLAGRSWFEGFREDPEFLADRFADFDFLASETTVGEVHRLYRDRTGRDVWEDSPHDLNHIGSDPFAGPRIEHEAETLKALFPRTWRAHEEELRRHVEEQRDARDAG